MSFEEQEEFEEMEEPSQNFNEAPQQIKITEQDVDEFERAPAASKAEMCRKMVNVLSGEPDPGLVRRVLIQMLEVKQLPVGVAQRFSRQADQVPSDLCPLYLGVLSQYVRSLKDVQLRKLIQTASDNLDSPYATVFLVRFFNEGAVEHQVKLRVARKLCKQTIYYSEFTQQHRIS